MEDSPIVPRSIRSEEGLLRNQPQSKCASPAPVDGVVVSSPGEATRGRRTVRVGATTTKGKVANSAVAAAAETVSRRLVDDEDDSTVATEDLMYSANKEGQLQRRKDRLAARKAQIEQAMSLSLDVPRVERTMERKDWHAMYKDLAASRGRARGADRVRPHVQDASKAMWAKAFVATRVVSRVRRIMQQRKFHLHRTLANMRPPELGGEWKEEWGNRKTICERCGHPALGEVAKCKLCPIVCHQTCLAEAEVEMVRMKEFVCEYCMEDFAQEADWFKNEVKKAVRERSERACALSIVNRMRGFTTRVKFLAKRRRAVQLQGFIRRVFARRRFTALLVNITRPFIARIHRLVRLAPRHRPAHIMIILSVVDVVNQAQLYRFDGPEVTLPIDQDQLEYNFEVIIPGASGNVSFVVTMLMWIENRWFASQQAQQSLRNTQFYRTGGDWDLPFADVTIMPRETKYSRTAYEVARLNGSLGFVHFELVAFNALSGICDSIEGPHLDVLKKSASELAQRADAVIRKKTSWWLVCIDNTLYFYRQSGDSRARFTTQLNLAIATEARDDDTILHAFKLVFPDKRRWYFGSTNQSLMKKWVFYVNAQRRRALGMRVIGTAGGGAGASAGSTRKSSAPNVFPGAAGMRGSVSRPGSFQVAPLHRVSSSSPSAMRQSTMLAVQCTTQGMAPGAMGPGHGMLASTSPGATIATSPHDDGLGRPTSPPTLVHDNSGKAGQSVRPFAFACK